MFNIELYPYPKSCSIQCPWCNLHDYWRSHSQTNKIDGNVADTFNILQEYMISKELGYALTYNLSENIEIVESIPNILRPDFCKAISIWLWKILQNQNYDLYVLSCIEKLMRKFKTVGNIIKVTITRPNIELSPDEFEIVKNIFFGLYNNISSRWSWWCWLWLEYNMHSSATIKKWLWVLKEQMNYFSQYLDSQIEIDENISYFDSFQRYWFKDWWVASVSIFESSLYREQQFFQIGGRTIARNKPASMEGYLNNAISTDCDRVSIYPHGVLIDHSSIEASNPFLRVPHSILRQSLMKNEPIKQSLKSIILNNITTYSNSKKQDARQDHLKLVNPK